MNKNLDKVFQALQEAEYEAMFKAGPMDGGDSGLDHPSTSLHQTCECSIHTMNIFLSNLATRTYPDPETPIFQIKTKLNTVGHFDFDAKAVTRWMRQIDPNMGSDVYSAPLKQFGGRFGVLDDLYTVGEDDGLEAKLGYGLQLTFHVDKSDQGYGIVARMEKVFADDESDMMPEPMVAEEETQLDEAYPVSGSFHRYMAGGKFPNQVRYETKWIPAPKNRLGSASSPAVGQRVKVAGGSGIDSNKEGNIRPWSEMKTDGRGIPTNLANSPYKPVDRNAERLIRFDDGTMVTMFTNRLLIPTQGDMIKESANNIKPNEEYTVVVLKNNKVVDQLSHVRGKEVETAIQVFKEMHGKQSKVSIEDRSGKIVYAEEVKLDEAMSVPQQHQFKIAKKTLKMSDAGANIMGGMSKAEARKFLKDIAKWSDARIKKFEDE